MALQKVDYVNQVTVITAENMNDIQDAIIALETAPSQGLSEEVKQALLQLAEEVAYASPLGQAVYTDLYNAFYPPVQVVSITAVFEQGTTVIYDDTALNDLKQYLTVTARYDDNTTAILADSVYSLSGTLAAGTSTVTVTYNSVTTTFAVNVTARPTLSSISAVYTQSGTVRDTDTLDSLKDDLVVTAHYSDSSTAVIPSASYTLSGTLTVGTSTITVSYGGMTTTFSVTVEHADTRLMLHNWDLTSSLTDSIGGLTMDLSNTNSGTALPTRDAAGLHFDAGEERAYVSGYDGKYADGRLFEFDISSANFAGDASKHKRFFGCGNDFFLIYRNAGAVQIYRTTWITFTAEAGQTIPTTLNELSGKTVGVLFGIDKILSLYIDGVLIAKTATAWTPASYGMPSFQIGGTSSGTASAGNDIHNMTITGIRIYQIEEAN